MSKRKYDEVDKSDSSPLRPMIFVLPTISPIKLLHSYPQAAEGLLQASSSGDLKMVRYLLEIGADINVKDTISGKTPLMRALRNNHNAVAKTLIKKGADLNLQDNFSNTALFIAASKGNLEIVEALIVVASTWEEKAYQIFLDQPHRMYGSPLQIALESGDAKVVKALVNAGASVTEGAHLKAFNIFRYTMNMNDICTMLIPDVSEDASSSLLPTTNELMQYTLMFSNTPELSGYIADTESEY